MIYLDVSLDLLGVHAETVYRSLRLYPRTRGSETRFCRVSPNMHCFVKANHNQNCTDTILGKLDLYCCGGMHKSRAFIPQLFPIELRLGTD